MHPMHVHRKYSISPRQLSIFNCKSYLKAQKYSNQVKFKSPFHMDWINLCGFPKYFPTKSLSNICESKQMSNKKMLCRKCMIFMDFFLLFCHIMLPQNYNYSWVIQCEWWEEDSDTIFNLDYNGLHGDFTAGENCGRWWCVARAALVDRKNKF